MRLVDCSLLYYCHTTRVEEEENRLVQPSPSVSVEISEKTSSQGTGE